MPGLLTFEFDRYIVSDGRPPSAVNSVEEAFAVFAQFSQNYLMLIQYNLTRDQLYVEKIS